MSNLKGKGGLQGNEKQPVEGSTKKGQGVAERSKKDNKWNRKAGV